MCVNRGDRLRPQSVCLCFPGVTHMLSNIPSATQKYVSCTATSDAPTEYPSSVWLSRVECFFFFSATLVLNCLFLLLDVLGASRLRTVGHMLGNAKHNTRPGLVADMEKRHGRYVVRKWTEKCVLPCHVLHSDIWQ